MMYLALAEGSPVKSRCLNRVLPHDVVTRLDPLLSLGYSESCWGSGLVQLPDPRTSERIIPLGGGRGRK